MVMSPDGFTLVTASWDGTIRFYNEGESKKLEMWVESLAYSPDNDFIVVGTHEIRFFERQNPPNVTDACWGIQMVSTVCVLHLTGTTVVSVSWDDTIRVWDLATGSNRLTIEGHFEFRGVALSPDGKTIATVSEKDIYLWNTSNGSFPKHFMCKAIGSMPSRFHPTAIQWQLNLGTTDRGCCS